MVVGDAKLELEYNDLNPQYPVMMVKLLDILFQSSKHLPSGEALLFCLQDWRRVYIYCIVA